MFEWYLFFGAIAVIIGIRLASKFSSKTPVLSANGKSIMITGCDSGIGYRCAVRMDKLGFKVFAGCLQPDGAGALQLKKACSGKLVIVPLDVTNDDSVQNAAKLVEDGLPDGQKGLYGLINNAGILIYGQFDWFTMQQAEMQVNVNLLGTMRVVKHFLSIIIKRPGRIVNVTSINGKFSYPGLTVYCATKFALEGFSDSLRYEMKKHGVKVAIIEPGDFSKVTNILDPYKANLKKMLDNLKGGQKDRCQKELEEAIKKLEKSSALKKLDPVEADKLYNILLNDMEDALLSEKPNVRYVSAPTWFKIVFFFLTKLPTELMDRLIEKIIKRASKKQ